MAQIGIVSLMTILSILAPKLSQGLDKINIWRLYTEGESYLSQANELVSADSQKAKELYLKAALSFEKIVEEGRVANGKLYYNIGNAYFRMGDIGKAILYYRRAEKLIPRDINLQHNISYARGLRIDRIEKKSYSNILQNVSFLHSQMNRYTQYVLFIISLNLTCFLSGVYLFRRRVLIKYLRCICIIVSIIFAGSILLEAFQQYRIHHGVIIADEVIARKGDSVTYEPSFAELLHAGTEFIMIEDRKGWYLIELADGRRCWIPGLMTELI
jgi:tetratricopeptide (TPR) repeat protein